MGKVAKVQMDKEMVLWNGCVCVSLCSCIIKCVSGWAGCYRFGRLYVRPCVNGSVLVDQSTHTPLNLTQHRETGQGMELTITDAQTVLADAYEGCSIAVNGVCLTVVTFDSALGFVCMPVHGVSQTMRQHLQYTTEQTFTVGCAPETIRRTNLGALQAGALVNLERCAHFRVYVYARVLYICWGVCMCVRRWLVFLYKYVGLSTPTPTPTPTYTRLSIHTPTHQPKPPNPQEPSRGRAQLGAHGPGPRGRVRRDH